MPPAVPRPAATVLLLRDRPAPPGGATPLQVFLQRRVAGMAFAGGMTVFPGGGVDGTDHEDVPWAGPGAAWWGERLACPPAHARALVQAAVRETFEECGVLLTDERPDRDWLAGARDDLVARRRSLGDLLRTAGLQLRSDLLHPWARWITPEESPRRYDTAFLVARVPDGQVADDRTTEAVEASWWHPADALTGAGAGELELMTPTEHALQELADHTDTASVIAATAGRRIQPVTPQVRRVGGRVVIVVPGGPGGELPAGHRP
ncbi:MAG: NUDIX hydrolase [Pseudonocardia sp.]